MPYFIGMDEAGYGPNLGPLVISGTLWQTPDELTAANLYDVLQGVITATPDGDNRRIALADSKKLYHPGGGLAGLERGVLAALSAAQPNIPSPTSWREIWKRFDPQSVSQLDALPWYKDFDAPIPTAVSHDDQSRTNDFFQSGLRRASVRLCATCSTVVFPRRLNELIDSLGSKGAALSLVTLDLLASMMAPLDEGPIEIICDKHGGRNKYGPLLQQAFPDHLIEVRRESRPESVYRWGPASRRVEARFVTKGERFTPTALASMISKYLRELAMRAFNHFWRQSLPQLKPTAGYPLDARRFKEEIAATQLELGVDDHILWRKR